MRGWADAWVFGEWKTRFRFTKIKKSEEDGDVHGWKELERTLKLDLAIALYQREVISLGNARRLAGISKWEFGMKMYTRATSDICPQVIHNTTEQQ
ncbi:MAG TPA: hypothetical protein EYP67_08495, partial [Methanosarcinales archaeon]|nr:hypothetical protein [Methanosarcinales archaeon]